MRDDVGDALLSVTAAAAAKGACCAAGKVPVTTEIRLRFDRRSTTHLTSVWWFRNSIIIF